MNSKMRSQSVSHSYPILVYLEPSDHDHGCPITVRDTGDIVYGPMVGKPCELHLSESEVRQLIADLLKLINHH